MSKKQSIALILCAGAGTRLRSSLPKVLHKVGGLPLLGHVLKTIQESGISNVSCVVGHNHNLIQDYVAPIPCCIQKTPLGTAHAVLAGENFVKSFSQGNLIVLFGDTPLLKSSTLEKLIKYHEKSKADLTLLGMEVQGPHSYGRIVLSEEGDCLKIVEDKDASSEEKKISLCNSGVMIFDIEKVWPLLKKVTPNNAKKEYYLTDLVFLCKSHGQNVQVYKAPHTELMGVNTRADLALTEHIFQERCRAQALENGVTLIAPETTFFSYDTILTNDVIVEPHVVFGPNVIIEEKVRICSFSHIEGAHIGKSCQVGPFARLRPGTILREKVKIGNFVEVKKSTFHPLSKANHLSYVGDADIGTNTNIGAGTITCNYDGFEKHLTHIEENVFIGSNTALVAPIHIGKDSIIGAGSVITKNISPDTLAIARGELKEIPNGAKQFRFKKKLSA